MADSKARGGRRVHPDGLTRLYKPRLRLLTRASMHKFYRVVYPGLLERRLGRQAVLLEICLDSLYDPIAAPLGVPEAQQLPDGQFHGLAIGLRSRSVE